MAITNELINIFCKGNGLEIGPGKNPYCNPETTETLDKFTDNSDATLNPDIISDARIIPRPDSHYDYVFSSHVLEHMQDTIGALKEWTRVLKQDGILFLLLPHADRIFDRFRDKTTLDHHILDHKELTSDADHSHNKEIIEGWSKLWNSEEERKEIFREYEEKWNSEFWDFDFRLANGIIHFHVWTQDEIVRLLQYLNLQILWTCEFIPERHDTFVVIARKK